MSATTTPAAAHAAPVRPSAVGERGPAVACRVAWSTVLALAVPMSLATGFWTVSLRTALGSIERTSSPSASWLRESTLLLPVFVLAVLGALTLAQRRFGRDLTDLREVVPVSLLAAVLGTLAGVMVLVSSSAYDYHLQVRELTTMWSMHDCSLECRGAVRQSTLALQERSVLVGSVLVLLTNLVLVSWVVALRGGRLRLIPARTDRFSQRTVLDRLGPARTLLVAGLLGSAAIHAVVMLEHLDEWVVAGGFFGLLAAAQLALAVGVLVVVVRSKPLPPGLFPACAVLSISPLLVWLATRTVGLPFGPYQGTPEPVGLPDVAVCSLEAVTAIAALVLLRSRAKTSTINPADQLTRLALVLVVAVTALGLGGTDASWLHLGAGEPGPTSHVAGAARAQGPDHGSAAR